MSYEVPEYTESLDANIDEILNDIQSDAVAGMSDRIACYEEEYKAHTLLQKEILEKLENSDDENLRLCWKLNKKVINLLCEKIGDMNYQLVNMV